MNSIRTHRRLLRSSAVVLGLALSAVSSTTSQAIDLKPKAFPLAILGVSVSIPVAISFDATSAGDTLSLQVRAQANLKGAQDKALDIARAIPMPSDNCARTGVNPVVNSIGDASIAPSGNTALIAITGHVTAWACGHPLGATVKTVIASDSVNLSAQVSIVVENQNRIGLRLAGPVTVNTGHALTAEVAKLLGGDVGAVMTTELAKALDVSAARASLPNFPGLEVTIQSAEFSASGADLVVNAKGIAHMNSDTFNALLAVMSK